MRAHRWIWLSLCPLLLVACIDPTVTIRRSEQRAMQTVQRVDAQANSHVVERGDTLYGIAFRYQLDFRDLAQRNSIYEPYVIYPGQRLALRDAPDSTASTSTQVANTQPPSASTERFEGSANNPITTQGTASEVSTTAVAGSSETLPPSVVPASEGFVSVSPRPSETPAPVAAAPVATAPVSTAPVSANPSANSAPIATSTAPNTQSSATTPSPTVTPTIAAVPANPPSAVAAPVNAAASAPKPNASGWLWPTEGRLLSTFLASDPGRQGVDIRGNLGQPVYAAKAGTVVYSGQGIRGYGELIVIKHDDATLSAYGHNSTRLAKEGQTVAAGAMIAEMGQDPQGRALLHFEVRRNGKPVDPLGALPKR